MTYRERREARAERLRGWAEKRQTNAHAILEADRSNEMYRDWAFISQPGHIPERARYIARKERQFASLDKATSMEQRAAGIEAQLDRAIYDDDPDAVERLTERIAELTRKRDAMKARNAEYRKTHRAELAALQSAYQRDCAMPHPSYAITNLTANISRYQKRLDALKGPRVPRRIYARRGGLCADGGVCGKAITPGEVIVEAEPGVWVRAECYEARQGVQA